MLIFDLEANGLLYAQRKPPKPAATLVHCGAYSKGGAPAVPCTAAELCQAILAASCIAGHNILRYDLPLLVKLGLLPSYRLKGSTIYWATGRQCQVVDTLVVSRLWCGDNTGNYSHSLESWGERLGIPKIQVSDWHGAGEATYHKRCIGDVVITAALYKYLEPALEPLAKALAIEHQFSDIIDKQVTAGVPFDVELAKATADAIAARMQALGASVADLLPNCEVTKGELDKARLPTKKYNPDGELNGQFKNWLAHRQLALDGRNIVDASGSCLACIDTDTHLKVSRNLELGNDAGMKAWLLDNGWEPMYWTHKKDDDGNWIKDANGNKLGFSPKVKDDGGELCPNLLGLMTTSGAVATVVKAYLAYGVYDHRLSTLKSLLAHPRLAIDGRIGADMTTLGARTGRVTHIDIANVPKQLNRFDAEHLAGATNAMRACFKAPEGFVLVGIDYSALEARMEADAVYGYGDYAEYNKLLLGDKPNDLHTHNARVLGTERDLAKRIKYLLSYGGSAKLLKSVLRCSEARAKDIYDAYWIAASCVKLAMLELEAEWKTNKRQYIQNIDGSRLYVSAAYKLWNTKLQGGGSKIVKVGAVLLDNQIHKLGLQQDVVKLIDYHDEYQFAVRAVDSLPEYVGKLAVACVKESGKLMGLNVPLDGEYQVGKHWGDTH